MKKKVEGESSHHRSLRLWEKDLVLGSSMARHAPILYAMDKLPHVILNNDGKSSGCRYLRFMPWHVHSVWSPNVYY